ncbi:alpha/beta hydrolase fold domain-containing protein [Sarocladium implicatum]|nr:alpha/beta hydrolase fold domain-containing protein [Sarocladium implicatum]
MQTKIINGFEIAYEDAGSAQGPAVVLLTGWAHDLGLYDEMVPLLVSNHRVIRMSWRGHSPSREAVPDFGVEEQFADAIGLLEALGVQEMYLVSHSHGGWPALELADRLGAQRVRCLVMIDQIMTSPPPAFASGLKAMQEPETWIQARQDLFTHWLGASSSNPVKDHLEHNLGSFDHRMWALSCRVIEEAYGTHGSPMGRMEKMRDAPPIRHIFSHPLDVPEYRELHGKFKEEHAFFSYTDLNGETHFPDLEIPQRCVEEIEDMIKSLG